MRRSLPVVLVACCLVAGVQAQDEKLVAALKALDTNVGAADGAKLSEAVLADIRRRLKEANAKSTEAWRAIKSREQWGPFRGAKLESLRASLGTLDQPNQSLKSKRTGNLDGEGFILENVLFEGRHGLWITANLYRPAEPREKMPGILICHSHHNPKSESELQVMGMTWARAGCLVLVMDQLGHGERRQHPFRTAADYPAAMFRASRQDYWFRYDVSLQLYLAGESLMGQMASDLMRGVDFLLSQEGIDKEKIVLLGAVAGGGDPAAVAGALDARITAVVPFNFGGPQPESKYPLPQDAEDTFDYAGSGSWESTRNLARSASSEGFLPWTIVGSIAPRRLVYGHEFSWDRERDPVWKRLETIYAWEKVPEHLAFSHGTGLLSGQSPEASHCNNIGAVHRRHIHAAFKKWFDIEVNPEEEYKKTFSSEQLRCVTADSPQPGLLREALKKAAPRGDWKESVREAKPREVKVAFRLEEANAMGERILLEAGVPIPIVLLRSKSDQPSPVIVCVAQQGKKRFLAERADLIARLLEKGIAVCLVDVRGTGETAVEGGRDRTSHATSLSASELMLGGTMLQQQLRDLRVAITYLRRDKQIDGKRIALWGESFAPVNAPDRELVVPHGIDRPDNAEPLGGMLVLLAALFQDDIRAVAVHRGLSSYASAFEGPCVYLPHDAIIPGAVAQGDVAGLVAGIAPTPIKMWDLTDAMNREVSPESAAKTFELATKAHLGDLDFSRPDDAALAEWFVVQMGKRD